MTDINVAAGTIPRGNWPREAAYLAYYWRSSGWLDYTHPVQETSPFNNGAPYKLVELTGGGDNPTLYAYDAHVLASTEDAIINPGGLRLGAFVLDANKRLIDPQFAALPGLESFRVPSIYADVTLAGLAGYNATTLPPVNPGDVFIANNLTVGGYVSATYFEGDGSHLTGITGATGGVSNTGSTNIAADSDADGVGVINFSTRNILRMRVNNDGSVEVGGSRVVTSSSLGEVSSANYANLAAAVAAIGSTPAVLLIAKDETIGADLAIAQQTTLRFTTGVLSIDDGFELTINGPMIDPGIRQVFDGGGTVTFTNKVNPVRPEWFGINTADALQKAHDSLPSTGGTILQTTSYSAQTQPIWIHKSNVTWEGTPSTSGTAVTISGAVRGPLVFVGNHMAPTFATSLATGAGSSLALSSSDNQRLSLNDGGTCDLNGLSAATVELYFKFTSLTGGFTDYLISSFRFMSLHGSQSEAFYIRCYADGSIGGMFNIGGTEKIVVSSAAAVANNTVYHVALTYDGSNVRLLLNGALIGTTAASGTITQAAAEDFFVGAPALNWPESGRAFEVPNGLKVDSIRVSNNARYTAAFTAPTTKRTSDGNTMILVNFDQVLGDNFIVADSSSGDVYLMYRAEIGAAYVNYLQLRNLSFLGSGGGSGLYTFDTPFARLENLSATGRYGFLFTGQKFLAKYNELRATTDATTGRVGVAFVGAPAAGATWDGGDIEGFPYGYVAHDGPSRMTNCFFNTFSDTITPLFIKGDHVEIDGMWMDDETAAGAGVVRKAAAIFSGAKAIKIQSGFWWFSKSALPIFQIDTPVAGASLSIDGVNVIPHASAAEVIDFIGTAPTVPLNLTSSYKSESGVPWSTTMNYISTGGTTINATDGKLPYRSSSSAFADSPITASVPISMVNGITVTGAATGNNVSIAATGSDSNVGLTLKTKAGGTFQFRRSDNTLLMEVDRGSVARVEASSAGGFYAAPTSNTFALQCANNNSTLAFRSDSGLSWSNDTTWYGTKDVGLIRVAAKVMEVNSGTAGSAGVLLLRGLAFASLPASPIAGMEATITDSNTNTWGATIAGGGANVVRAFYNGSAWTVTGR